MSWIKITEDKLATYQAGKLVDAMKTKALGDGQENPLPEAIRVVVEKIRGAIAAGGYSLDKDSSLIPAELERDAFALVVAVAKPRLSLELKDDEKTANLKALELLDKIAAGDFDVSMPDNPDPNQAAQNSGGCQLVRPARGVPTRNDFNGL